MSEAVDLSQGAGRRANVEFVSAYPTRALRAEDAYAAVIGDVISNMLSAAGWDVCREYFVNDTGPQADALARGVYARCIAPSDFAEDDIAEIAGRVRGQIAPSLLQASEAEWLEPLRAASIDAALASVRGGLDGLGVRFDVFTKESTLGAHAALHTLMQRFAAAGLLTNEAKAQVRDVPDAPKGRLFLATDTAGDTRARALTGGDGRSTYFASDLAYHANKLARGFELLVDVFRRDHASYAPGLAAGITLMSEGRTALSVCLIDPVKPAPSEDVSPRAFESHMPPSLADLLDFYGAANLRHLFLSHAAGTPLEIGLSAELKADLAHREAQQKKVFDLPEGGEDHKVPELDPLEPHALMQTANTLTNAAHAQGAASAPTKETLLSLRKLMGLER